MGIIFEYVNKIFNVYFLMGITFLMKGYLKIGYEWVILLFTCQLFIKHWKYVYFLKNYLTAHLIFHLKIRYCLLNYWDDPDNFPPKHLLLLWFINDTNHF